MQVLSVLDTSWGSLSNPPQSPTLKTSFDLTSTKNTQDKSALNISQNRLSMLKEKYKDVYTPLPMSYSTKDEDFQAQKIKEFFPKHVPDYVIESATDKIAKEQGLPFCPHTKLDYLNLLYGKTKKQTDEIRTKLEKVYKLGVKELTGIDIKEELGLWKEIVFKKDDPPLDPEKVAKFTMLENRVAQVKRKYPINKYFKRGLSNAKELTRFTNAVIYEGLEKGRDVKTTLDMLPKLIRKYIDPNYEDPNNLSLKLESKFRTPSKYTTSSNIQKYKDDTPIHIKQTTQRINKYMATKLYNNEQDMKIQLENSLSKVNPLFKELTKSCNEYYKKQNRTYENSTQHSIITQWQQDTQIMINVFKHHKIYTPSNNILLNHSHWIYGWDKIRSVDFGRAQKGF